MWGTTARVVIDLKSNLTNEEEATITSTLDREKNNDTLKLVIEKYETYKYNNITKEVEIETQESGDKLVYAMNVRSGILTTVRINVDEL